MPDNPPRPVADPASCHLGLERPRALALLTQALVPLEPVDAFFPGYTERRDYRALRKWAHRTFHTYLQKEHNHG